jgi:DoxX-like family
MTLVDTDPIAWEWAGDILSALVALALFADAAHILSRRPSARAELAATGFAEGAAVPVGIIALVCAALYAVPQTAVLGAILTTGFLGGAICTHFRLGRLASPPQIASLVLGIMAWGGLYLRNADLRALLPFAG